jgi:hypothetical protein
MPPRITQQSHRPPASHRMMVGTYANTWLAELATERRQALPLHETIKSGSATGAGIAAELRGDPKR